MKDEMTHHLPLAMTKQITRKFDHEKGKLRDKASNSDYRERFQEEGDRFERGSSHGNRLVFVINSQFWLESGNGQTLNDFPGDFAATLESYGTSAICQRGLGQCKQEIAPAKCFPVQSIGLV
jgi:hypothetical protein